jgi:SAM-dependent methyltransferase
METHIGGYVEQVSTHHVTGWAADLNDTMDISVRLRLDDQILSRTLPAFVRSDVETVFNISRRTGFYLAYEKIGELLARGALIEAGTDKLGYVRLDLVEGALEVKAQRYQDFAGGEAGNSKSQAKLDALQLEFLDHLKSRNVRVLDVGCNEGFFCDAVARRLNAGYVLGIDSEKEYIGRASLRFPQYEFRHQSWWQVEEGDFDVILFLSAVHYEKDQASLFRILSRKLRQGGVLILECGIADPLMVHPEEKWVIAHRQDGLFRYPTYSHLMNGLLESFSVKYIEKSIAQAGDPVDRHVLHCWSKRQDIIILSGKSGSGKTELARGLGQSPEIQTIHTDLLILRLLTDSYLESSGLASRLRRFFEWPANIELIQRYLQDMDLIEEYLDILMLTIDRACRTVVIEGVFLDHPAMFDALTKRLTAEARLWRIM